jgi:hypothetical protein
MFHASDARNVFFSDEGKESITTLRRCRRDRGVFNTDIRRYVKLVGGRWMSLCTGLAGGSHLVGGGVFMGLSHAM